MVESHQSFDQPLRKPVSGKSTRHSILKPTASNFNSDQNLTSNPSGGYLDPPPIKPSSNHNHFKPYYKRRPPQAILRHPTSELDQLQNGIVAGSSFSRLFPSSHISSPNTRLPDHPLPALNQDTKQNHGARSLLSKCVGWLFGPGSPSPDFKKAPSLNPPRPTNGPSNHISTSTRPKNQLTIHPSPSSPPPLLASNLDPPFSSVNLSRAPQSSHQSALSRLTPSVTLPQLPTRPPDQPWYRSQSPFVPWPHPSAISTSSSTSSFSLAGRRHPTTSHAQLQIASTSASSSNLLNAPSTPVEVRMRSVSPTRAFAARSSGLAPLAQRSSSPFRQGSSFLTRPTTSIRPSSYSLRATSVFGQRAASVALDDPPESDSGRKRAREDMSISPVRYASTFDTRDRAPSLLFGTEAGLSAKKQMCWDPELGFMTQQQMEEVKLEKERKQREVEGRPFPTNEAERILEALESRRGATSALSEARRMPNLPRIPAPAPSSMSTQRSSSIQLLARSKTKNSLAALYEDEDDTLQKKKVIAPFSKRIEQDRIKRLEEKKGKLREELKKRRKYEERLRREENGLKGHGKSRHDRQGQESEQSDEMQEPSLPPGSRRSRSVESSASHAPQPRRSNRKIGKLTSSSTKAKVNSGRRSRDASVNDEEGSEDHQVRVTRSKVRKDTAGVLPSSNGRSVVAPSLRGKKPAKTPLNSLKSPSPIQEEEEGHGHKSVPTIDFGLRTGHGSSPETNAPALHSLIRSSSASLQPMVSATTKSSSSLRPGRTFSSRRHTRAKVFSAREEDLPSLGDEEADEEAAKEIASLKKIKLPTTFPSSFKLDKFASSKATAPSDPVVATQTDTTHPSAGSNSVFDTMSSKTPAMGATSGIQPTNFLNPSAASFSFLKPTDEPVLQSHPTPSLFSKPAESSSASNALSPLTKLVEPVSTSNPSLLFSKPAESTQASNSTSLFSKPAEPLLSSNPSPFFTKPAEPPAPSLTKEADSSRIPSFGRIPSDAPPPNFFGTAINGANGKPAATTNSLFGASTSPFAFTSTTASIDEKSTSDNTAMLAETSKNNETTQSSQPPQASIFGGGLFSAPAASSSTPVVAGGDAPKSIFGAPATTSNPAATTFAFGTPTHTTSQAAQAPSLFGNVAPVSASNQSGAAPSSTGFSFTTPVASQPVSQSLFGASDASKSSVTTSAPSIFGNGASSNPVGVAPSNSLTAFNFNGSSTTNPSSDGNGTNLFGNSVTASTSAPSFTFGAVASPAAPSTASPFAFNSSNNPPTSSPFAFGSTPAPTGFGSTNASTGFGSTSTTTSFGSTPATTGFGSTPTTNNFSFAPASAAGTPLPTSSGFNFGAGSSGPPAFGSSGAAFGSSATTNAAPTFSFGGKDSGLASNATATSASLFNSDGSTNGSFGALASPNAGSFTFGAGTSAATGGATPGTSSSVLFSIGAHDQNAASAIGSPGGARLLRKLPAGRKKR